jgi:hypothetical protein
MTNGGYQANSQVGLSDSLLNSLTDSHLKRVSCLMQRRSRCNIVPKHIVPSPRWPQEHRVIYLPCYWQESVPRRTSMVPESLSLSWRGIKA